MRSRISAISASHGVLFFIALMMLSGCLDSGKSSKSNGSTAGTSNSFQNLEISPLTLNIPAGLKRQLHANAITTQGTQEDVTDEVNWLTSDDSVLTVDENGLLQAVEPGEAVVTAALGDTNATLMVTVSSGDIQSIVITSTRDDDRTMALGETIRLVATGFFPDDVSLDITDQVNWSSEPEAVATINEAGEITPLSPGDVTFTASFADTLGHIEFEILSITLQGITISPSNETRDQGKSVNYVAQAHFDEGPEREVTADVTWTSDNEEIALIANSTPPGPGIAFAIGEGQATIEATFGNTQAETTLTVNNADYQPAFLSVEVVPDVILKGGTDKATVTATAFPFNPDQSIPLGTGFTFSVPGGNAELTQASLQTGDDSGKISTDVSAAEAGMSIIRVDADETFAWGHAAVAAVTGFEEIFNALQLADDGFDELATLPVGFRFILVVSNPSNRPFEVVRYQFGTANGATLVSTEDPQYLNGNIIKGREAFTIPIKLGTPLKNEGFTSTLEMREPNTGETFSLVRHIP